MPSDGSGANALLSQMDDTLGRIKAESHDNIRRAESQHALKLEGVKEAFEAKLKLAEKTWDDERAGLLKKCTELEESNKEAGRRLESMSKGKEAVDELLQSMKQKVAHLEEQAASAEQRVSEAMRQRRSSKTRRWRSPIRLLRWQIARRGLKNLPKALSRSSRYSRQP